MVGFDRLGDVAYMLIVSSYLVKDVLWLRAIACLASVCILTFNFFVLPAPLWVIVRWNAVMLVINLVQMIILVHDRRDTQMNEEEAEIHSTVFKNLSPVEFKKLLRLGVRRDVPAEKLLVREGEKMENLTLLYSGAAAVIRQGKQVATLKDGAFIGEMSFITHKNASATVTTNRASKIIQWPFDPLNRLLIRNPSLGVSLQAVLGTDMAHKLE